ncbi:unnamed protein product [Phytophthora lilii]|uniref:Unnamed protein product n=1 Tax=Phytophthora lilii TaxID=2077276 RepID=A0A9W6X3U7_9STRA|nr:unnamed protein product [Phytophthora lilii]
MFISYLALKYFRYETSENVGVSVKSIEDDDTYTLLSTPKADRTDENVILDLPIDRCQNNFIPVMVAFQDLHYWVPDPRNSKNSIEPFKGISGYATPGSITALMGSTGAGNTTLMDVIAGYCEQMDGHSTLTFSSFVRQDASFSDAKKFDLENEYIGLLGLEDIVNQITRGSSVEQMKRLTIGVELAAQPSVIFLDEPTSGHDARSAKIIMDGVRKVADSGRSGDILLVRQTFAAAAWRSDCILW